MKDNRLTAQDLMIGDWVEFIQSDGQGFYAQVEALINDGIFSESGFYADNDVSPIPLTAEILEKNFPKSHDIDYWVDGNFPIIGYSIPCHTDGNLPYVEVSIYDPARVMEFEMYLHYVHELQHALRLCGFEKDIEL